jgi:SAM-dependent methyltransferase
MKRFIAAIKNAIKESGILPSFRVRERLAASYLKGEGLEIGALHFPLKTPEGVVVRYVDIAGREENIRRFPELDASRIVNTDHIGNGFELATIPASSQDFIIANHVLEHAGNPLKVLLNWGRVLKPDGILLVTVPVAARCFDRGRRETTLEHFMEDFRVEGAGDARLYRERNREHFLEWLQVSEPNLARARGDAEAIMDGSTLEKRLEEMSGADDVEIHFHTFSEKSYKRLLEHFAAHVAGNFQLMDIRLSRGGAEVAAVLKKLQCNNDELTGQIND